MRVITLTMAACLFGSAAIACEVEDWRWRMTIENMLVEGVATCEKARIALRFYDGEGANRKFVGTAQTWISGFIFEALIHDVRPEPKQLVLEYSIRE